MKQPVTLINLISIWQGLKARREALNLTQPDMAKALDLSLSTYTQYEISGEKLTVERLMQLDGKISMLEKTADKGVGNPVDKSGENISPKRMHRLPSLTPKAYVISSPGEALTKHMSK